MMIQLEKQIKLLEPMVRTNFSVLHKAIVDGKENQNGLYYVVKAMPTKQKEKGISLEKEMNVTHMIENFSESSVVIPILMYAESKGEDYGIMQLKHNGRFLNQLITDLEIFYEGKIDLRVQLRLMQKILKSLECIHHCMPNGDGFLHLDIQPCNIFVENVELDYMDFGSAKFIDFQSALPIVNGTSVVSDKDYIIVTEQYAASELWSFEHTLSYQTDIYSIGCIFYRMLTGEEYEGMVSQENLSLRYPSLVAQQLNLILECCLEEDAKYRYASAKEVRERLECIEKYINAYERMDYYELFSSAYAGWIPQEDIIVSKILFDSSAFLKAVLKIEQELENRETNKKRCEYIFLGLWKLKQENEHFLSQEMSFGTDAMKALSSLLSSGIRIANHMGNPVQAVRFYEELEKYKDEIPLMEYLEIRNRVAVIYSDCYEFEHAYELIEKNIIALEPIKEVYEKVAKQSGLHFDRASYVKPLAKAYSAMGCYLTYLHKEGAEKYFEKALKEFGDDRIQTSITLSHVLHYAIEMGNRGLYEEKMKLYFEGKEGFAQRYAYAKKKAIQEGRPQLYPLWIFLKGLLYFYPNDFSEDLLRQMKQDFYDGLYDKVDDFPMLLIYRYLGQLAYIRNDNEIDAFTVDALEKSLLCCENGKIDFEKPLGMMVCISYETARIYNEMMGEDEDNQELLEMFKEHAQNSGWQILERELERRGTIEGILEFEYC